MRRFLYIFIIFCALLPGRVRGEAPAASIQAFAAAFAAHADRLETDFFIPCDSQLQALIMGEGLVAGESLLTEIKGNNGIYKLTYVQKDDGIRFSECRYYEGRRMLHAYRSNTVRQDLSPREQQALEAALRMTAAVSGTELEIEKQLHDALCAHVSYYTESLDTHKAHDCAVGALLDGRADCDGYSDAFYLLGSLAGLEVRFVEGDSLPREGDQVDLDAGEKTIGHMWNAVKIHGKWVMLDVTWDDANDTVRYLYFNNGQDRHLLTHQWDDRTLSFTVEASAGNNLRPAGLDYHYVDSWDQVYALLRSAAEQRAARVCVAYPAGFDLRSQRSALGECVYSLGVTDFHWDFGGLAAELYGLQYENAFRICDTQQQALDFIDSCAQQGIRDFALYFYPPLGRQLFADERAGLIALLAQSRLQNITYAYYESGAYIRVSDAAYIGRFPTLLSREDILLYLRAQARLRSASLVFYTPQDVPVDVAACIRSVFYSMGAESFSSMASSGRYIVSDIRYYPEFRLVDSRQEAADYLAGCLRSGISACRLYCSDALYQELMRDGGQAIFGFLRGCGLMAGNVSYNEDYRMIGLQDLQTARGQ